MGGFMGRRKVPLYMRPPDGEEKRGFGLAATPPKEGRRRRQH